MRYVIPMIIVSTSLMVGSEINVQVNEGGLIHTKQKGRYEVVKSLPNEADSFDTLFDYAKVFGTFRLANVVTQHDALDQYNIEKERKSGTAFGGIFGFETASLYGVKGHVAAYTSQKITSLNVREKQRQNKELFNGEGDSYTYLGEASLGYKDDTVQVQAGRIRMETPYVNSDDIRMSPNSFEGISFHVDLLPSWQVNACFLTRWAGTDTDDVEIFTPFVEGGYGLAGGAMTYRLNEENEISLWYYNIDKESDIIYAEAAGDVRFNKAFHMEWGLQGAHIMERSDSHVDGDVLGAMVIADLGYLYAGLSMNYVFEDDNNSISDGFGGGPYYTSLDEQTIGTISALSPGHDLLVYRLALGVDLSSLGVNALNLEYVHGHFIVQDAPVDARENDLVLTYSITKRWYFEMIYSDISLTNISYTLSNPNEIDSFERLVSRLDYKF